MTRPILGAIIPAGENFSGRVFGKIKKRQ